MPFNPLTPRQCHHQARHMEENQGQLRVNGRRGGHKVGGDSQRWKMRFIHAVNISYSLLRNMIWREWKLIIYLKMLAAFLKKKWETTGSRMIGTWEGSDFHYNKCVSGQIMEVERLRVRLRGGLPLVRRLEGIFLFFSLRKWEIKKRGRKSILLRKMKGRGWSDLRNTPFIPLSKNERLGEMIKYIRCSLTRGSLWFSLALKGLNFLCSCFFSIGQ